MRVAVVDIGTNSTRLLIADVGDGGALEELRRESIVTRLGAQVDATGRLRDDAMQRVFDTLARFRGLIDEHGASATAAVLTSAVRDAANGSEFAAAVRKRYDLDARTIAGDEEAALTFAGATSERADSGDEVLVVDIGGGSTEFVTGCKGAVDFHVSTQAGVVRQTERHIDHDPPRPDEVDSVRREVSQIIRDNVPAERRRSVALGIAVAGTATSCAAIELGLDPYDRAHVHGHVLRRTICTGILDRLSHMTDAERRARHRPAARPCAHDRRRRRDAARGHGRLRPRARSRSPSTTSCAAPRCGWRAPIGRKGAPRSYTKRRKGRTDVRVKSREAAADTRRAGRGDPAQASRGTAPDIGPDTPFIGTSHRPDRPIRPRKVRTPARPAGPIMRKPPFPLGAASCFSARSEATEDLNSPRGSVLQARLDRRG